MTTRRPDLRRLSLATEARDYARAMLTAEAYDLALAGSEEDLAELLEVLKRLCAGLNR